MKYRKEIDGLRALAVLPVVLFHAGWSALSGGFVGVDIFFVISGYLITRILMEEIGAGRFTFLNFYERRARRILPALLLVLFVSLLLVCFLGLPAHVEDTARSVIFSILSVSNIYFWSESSYFAPVAELKPLLHSWSLGVEEQFYLLFPIFLVVCFNIRLHAKWILAMSLPLLFALSLWLSYEKPVVAFYWLPARAWELALGALLALGVFPECRPRAVRSMLSLLGLALILVSFFVIRSQDVFPGYVALLPCLGAALILHCAKDGVWVQRLLSSPVLVCIGLISYSLYLWHWPLLAFARMRWATIDLPVEVACGAVAVTLLLAAASWRWVEQPFRSKLRVSRAFLLKALGVGILLLMAGSFAAILQHGWPARMEASVRKQLSAAQDVDPMRQPCEGFKEGGRAKECRFGEGQAKPSYVILGDSHAAALRPVFDRPVFSEARTGSLWWMRVCPPILGATTTRPNDQACKRFIAQSLEALRASPEITHVLLAARWNAVMTGLQPETGGSYRFFLTDDESQASSPEETAQVFKCALQRMVKAITVMGKDVVIVGAVPEPGFDVSTMSSLAAYHQSSAMLEVRREAVAARNRDSEAFFRQMANTYKHVHYIPVWDIFCQRHACALMDGGVPLYYDDDHITHTTASQIVGPALEERFSSVPFFLQTP